MILRSLSHSCTNQYISQEHLKQLFFFFHLLNYSSGSRRCNLIGKTSLDSRNEITPTTIQNLTRSTRQSSGSEGESLTRTANTGKTLRHYANLASILILNTKTSSSSFSRKFYVWITKTCVQVQPAEASLWKQIFLAFEWLWKFIFTVIWDNFLCTALVSE